MIDIRSSFLLKTALVLLTVVLVAVILVHASEILIPLVFAGFLAILLYPMSRFLERRHIPRFLSILIAVLFSGLLLAGILSSFGIQFSEFTTNFPAVRAKAAEYFTRFQVLVQEEFGIPYKDQLDWLKRGVVGALEGENGLINRTFLAMGDVFSLVLLVPLFTFLFLYYRDLLMVFVFDLFPEKNDGTVRKIIGEIQVVMKNYVVGLLLETCIVAVLATGALLLLGIDYAVLFGISASIFNLIPFIGGILGGLFPLVIAILTTDSFWYPVGVLAAMISIQALDSYVIIPSVMGYTVKINALVTLISVFVGGYLWGLAGMLLSRPIVAILKVICDNVEPLKPVGAFLGVPDSQNGINVRGAMDAAVRHRKTRIQLINR